MRKGDGLHIYREKYRQKETARMRKTERDRVEEIEKKTHIYAYKPCADETKNDRN